MLFRASRRGARYRSLLSESRRRHPVVLTARRSSSQVEQSGAFEAAAAPFVSKHARLRDGELQQGLQDNNLSHHDPGGSWLRVRECPLCHPTNNKMENMFKLHLSKATGGYHCFRCGAKGSYQHFKHRLQMLRQHGVDVGSEPSLLLRKEAVAGNVPKPHAAETEKWRQRLSESTAVQQYLQDVRGLTMEVVEKYEVGVAFFNFKERDSHGETEWTRHECLAFPMYSFDNSLVRYKIRGVQEKRNMRLHPAGASWGLFGLNTVPSNATSVVLTEGEFDAMAVHQATGHPAVSLPNGASSLPPAILPLLERFKKVYLWMDCDAAGRANQHIFARKLGIGRTVLVGGEIAPNCKSVSVDAGTIFAKDANEALLKNMDLTDLLNRAKRIPHEQIIALETLREDVMLHLRDPLARAGIQFNTMPGLNKTLKGHRRGEFSVLTGPTGVGKTTLLMQLSLDLAAQGVRTLWGSFEIPNSRLVTQLFTQFIGNRDDADFASMLSKTDSKHSALDDAWEDFAREIPVSCVELGNIS